MSQSTSTMLARVAMMLLHQGLVYLEPVGRHGRPQFMCGSCGGPMWGPHPEDCIVGGKIQKAIKADAERAAQPVQEGATQCQS